MQKITPFLWFDDNAEEAMNFYVSIFKNSKPGTIMRRGNTGTGPKDSVMTVTFQLEGQDFYALNGGPHFKFTPAISFFVNCETQAEIDELWEKLKSGGGEEMQCGWVKDKFGVCWQIIPAILNRLLRSESNQKSASAMKAMMKMVKLDIQKLQQAYHEA
jgi:predicted 3-demethylubiquinone-9 3-methyltransferase (glyoxalase superfamily)